MYFCPLCSSGQCCCFADVVSIVCRSDHVGSVRMRCTAGACCQRAMWSFCCRPTHCRHNTPISHAGRHTLGRQGIEHTVLRHLGHQPRSPIYARLQRLASPAQLVHGCLLARGPEWAAHHHHWHLHTWGVGVTGRGDVSGVSCDVCISPS